MIDLELNSSIDLKREGKSFYWASFFLPKSSKKNAGILYSICRYFDDIADKYSEDQTNYLKNSIQEIQHYNLNKSLFLEIDIKNSLAKSEDINLNLEIKESSKKLFLSGEWDATSTLLNNENLIEKKLNDLPYLKFNANFL